MCEGLNNKKVNPLLKNEFYNCVNGTRLKTASVFQFTPSSKNGISKMVEYYRVILVA